MNNSLHSLNVRQGSSKSLNMDASQTIMIVTIIVIIILIIIVLELLVSCHKKWRCPLHMAEQVEVDWSPLVLSQCIIPTDLGSAE